MFYQIYADLGYNGYRSFWREMNLQPLATTAEQAMTNIINAAYHGTSQDYRDTFKAQDVPSDVPLPPTILFTAGCIALLAAIRSKRRGRGTHRSH